MAPPADKKGDKKEEKPAGWNLDATEAIIVGIFFLAILSTVVPAIIHFIREGQIYFFGLSSAEVIEFFRSALPFLKLLGLVLGGLFAYGTYHFNNKGDAIWTEEKMRVNSPTVNKKGETVSIPEVVPAKNPQQEKWERIVKNSQSENSSDWRLAIIEADIMLDDLLEKLHLPGDTMGDKLKAIEKSDFNTIEYAWEAHKARNMIAHQGEEYLLNQRECRRIISLYEAVFREFHLIT